MIDDKEVLKMLTSVDDLTRAYAYQRLGEMRVDYSSSDIRKFENFAYYILVYLHEVVEVYKREIEKEKFTVWEFRDWYE